MSMSTSSSSVMRIITENWENNSNKIKELENSKDLEHNYMYLKPRPAHAGQGQVTCVNTAFSMQPQCLHSLHPVAPFSYGFYVAAR